MARGATTQNLFLQITGSATGVQQAAKVAKVSLAELGAASGDLQKVVAENFRKLGGGDLTQSARQLEASYRKTFANIRAAAEDTLSKPTSAGSIVSGNLAGAEQQLTAARATAAAYRELADAQTRMVSNSTSVAAGERELAVVLETQALAAKEDITGIEQRIAVLRRLQTALGTATDAETEASGSHTRLGASGLIAEHVVRSFSDSIAAGQSPVRALTMEMGRITEAMTLFAAQSGETQGAVGKFASFMGGPWGLAISVGVAAIVPLVTNLIEASTESDGLKGKVLGLADALSAEKFGTDAARKALEDYNTEKAKARDADSNAIALSLAEARARLQNAIAIREEMKAEAEKLYTSHNYDPNGGMQGQIGAAGGYQAQVNSQTSTIATLQGNIRNLEIDAAKDAAKAAADPIEAIRQKYQHMADAATKAAASNDKLAASLTPLLTKYSIQEAAEIKLAEARKSAERTTATDNRQSGRQIDIAQAEGIVQGIGGRVTSSYRSTAEQQVLYDRYKAGQGPLAAKPGTSEHERGQALDIAKSAGMTLAKIVEAFAAQGVHLTERLDEGDHYHVAWGPKGRQGPSADTLARRQQAATRKDANDDRAYQSQIDQTQEAYARAMIAISGTTQQRSQIEVQSLRDRLTQRLAEIDDLQDAKKIPGQTAQEVQLNADRLRTLAKDTEALDEQAVRRKQLGDIFDQQFSIAKAQMGSASALLDLRQQSAVGRRDQYAVAKQSLTQRQQTRYAGIINQMAPETEGVSEKDRAQAFIDYQALPATEAQENANLSKQYQSPLDQYKEQLQSSVGNMSDALQGVGLDAFKGFEDGFAGIVTGAETASQAIKSMATSIIADLARIAIEKAALAIFGLKGGGVIPGKASGGVAGYALGGIPGYAAGVTPSRAGNRIRGAGTGTSDSILAFLGSGRAIRVANGEGIMTEKAVQRFWPMLDAMNKGTFRGFAGGGLPSDFRQADLSTSDIRMLSSPRSAPGSAHILVQVEEGALFRPVVSDISARHAQAAMIGGARQAAEDRHDEEYSAIPQ